MHRGSIRRVTALVVSLALPFALVLPLHTHTCHWPTAASRVASLGILATEAGPTAESKGACLACTLGRRLQAPVTVPAAALHALPAIASVALGPLPVRPVSGAVRLIPPRGPPPLLLS